jgi:hypothetical protein
MNHVEQHISDSGNVRWAFTSAHYFWFVGGATEDQQTQAKMKYRITRDVITLSSSTRRRRLVPVALITSTQASPLLLTALATVPGWRTLVFGGTGLNVDNPDLICANTADVILCYGNPSETLTTMLDSQEQPPELIRRNMYAAKTERQALHTKITDPYERYWTDVDRLRKDRVNPEPGLIMREIDVRPQFSV